MVDKAEARDAISKLIYGYAEALDGGDLPRVGAFFEHAVIKNDAGDVRGAEAAMQTYVDYTAFFDEKGWVSHRFAAGDRSSCPSRLQIHIQNAVVKKIALFFFFFFFSTSARVVVCHLMRAHG